MGEVVGIVFFKDGHTEEVISYVHLLDGTEFETASGEYWYEQGAEFEATSEGYIPVHRFFTYNRDTLLFQDIDFIDHVELNDGGRM